MRVLADRMERLPTDPQGAIKELRNIGNELNGIRTMGLEPGGLRGGQSPSRTRWRDRHGRREGGASRPNRHFWRAKAEVSSHRLKPLRRRPLSQPRQDKGDVRDTPTTSPRRRALLRLDIAASSGFADNPLLVLREEVVVDARVTARATSPSSLPRLRAPLRLPARPGPSSPRPDPTSRAHGSRTCISPGGRGSGSASSPWPASSSGLPCGRLNSRSWCLRGGGGRSALS